MSGCGRAGIPVSGRDEYVGTAVGSGESDTGVNAIELPFSR
ncbi:hypothetical protein BN903_48 [Halorubrum sp. AJ67]|nr:hypothetical protein BN903_48 [Halorubrum sp. AJ67]